MPTQPRLLALAEMLNVPAQWLRYGNAEEGKTDRTSAEELIHALGRQYPGLLRYEGLSSMLDNLAKLNPKELRIVDGLIRVLQADSGQK